MFHFLALNTPEYNNIKHSDKISFLKFMLFISSLFILSYIVLSFALLLPLKTIILGILSQLGYLSQLYGFDLPALIISITDVYLPNSNLTDWLYSFLSIHNGETLPTLPTSLPESLPVSLPTLIPASIPTESIPLFESTSSPSPSNGLLNLMKLEKFYNYFLM